MIGDGERQPGRRRQIALRAKIGSTPQNGAEAHWKHQRRAKRTYWMSLARARPRPGPPPAPLMPL
eukprot:7151097-Alexandrium_andersonii.AAC.1